MAKFSAIAIVLLTIFSLPAKSQDQVASDSVYTAVDVQPE